MEHYKKRKAKLHMDKLPKRPSHKMAASNRSEPSPILRDRSDDECSDESIEKSSSESAELMSEEEFCPILELEGCCVETAINPDTRYLNPSGVLSFTFKIENISAFCSRQDKVYSDSFECRDIPFSLAVHSKGRALSLAAYLKRDTTTNDINDQGLEIQVSCEISVVNQLNGCMEKRLFTGRPFSAGSDWGFNEILCAYNGSPIDQGYLHNNSLLISVLVKADPPYCNSNHSKAVTGYVGIRNQGATCYMNSLLQVLFFITKFRTACYRIPTEMDDESSIAFALQKVFYNLEFSDMAVCTKNLTKSFGWSNVDVLMQHDIQEMMRVLIDKIEGRMKNTLLEPILPSIFQGKFVSYVKCRDIEFSSHREEVFYDIQLSLDNSSNLFESFKRYIAPEMMDDDNKYHAGTHGLQAAEKGTLFLSLPPVMFLHLLRFQFDATTSQVIKNNNFFEFYEHFDLTDFVREEGGTTWKYTLFAVLSHSGGGSQGHYVAYINPALEGQWLKFNDDTISLVHQRDAIEANFGSNNDVDECSRSLQFNAYMLVYVRDSSAGDLFEPVDPKYITEELKNASQKYRRQVYTNNPASYSNTTDVYVFLTTFLESDFRFTFARPDIMPRFSLDENVKTHDFIKQIQTAFNIDDSHRIRIWPIKHMSQCSRPTYITEDAKIVKALSDLNFSKPYSVWVEIAPPGSPELPPFDPKEDILVFYHYYGARESRPFYMHHGYHKKTAKVEELIPLANQLMGWPDLELNIYQEFRDKKVCEMNPSNPFSYYIHGGATTYVLQVFFEPKEHDTSTKLNSISLYYQDFMFHATIYLRNVDHWKSHERFDISLQITFPELLNMVASRLNYDKKKIQIFNSEIQCQRDARGDPIPSSSTETLHNLLICGFYDTLLLFYKLHTVDVIDVETKRQFTFLSRSIDIKKTHKHTLYLLDDETIETILAQAEQILDVDRTIGSGKFRVVCETGNRLSIVEDSKEIYENMDADNFQRNTYFRIEEIPKGDELLNEDEKLVLVFQQHRPHGMQSILMWPILFKINMNESWQRVKDRLRCRLNFSEKVWGDYGSTIEVDNEPVDMDDDNRLIDREELSSTFSIRLHYKNKVKRTSSKVEFSEGS